jgi:hypothetical protein
MAEEAKKEETALAKPSYMPKGISPALIKEVENPNPSDINFPFAAGQKMHEVMDYQNHFTLPVDTAYSVIEAIEYFSNEKNRERYTYDQQQLIWSRIARAAMDFGIDIEDVTDKIKV